MVWVEILVSLCSEKNQEVDIDVIRRCGFSDIDKVLSLILVLTEGIRRNDDVLYIYSK